MADELPAAQNTEEVFDIKIDDLFKDPEDSPPQNKETSKTPENKDDDMTARVTKRINDVRSKTEKETQERAAKIAGFNSWDEMVKASEQKVIKDNGLDPKQVEGVLKDLLEKRLADDPRLKELEHFKAREKDAYVKQQLIEINKIAGTKFTKAEELPPETIALWSKGIELEQAFLATAGKTIITKGADSLSKGTLNHMAPHSSNSGTKTRGLTEEEKQIWRSVVPGITEEELAKKTKPVKED